MPIETLDLTGMDIDSLTWRGETLRADFGSGYGAKAVVGDEGGLHRWSISSGCLPDDEEDDSLINGLPAMEYYFDFYRRHTTGDNDVFMIEFRGGYYHASFAETEMSFEMFTIDLFGGGVEIMQRCIEGSAYNADGSIDFNNPATNYALNADVWANRSYLYSRPEQAVNGYRHTQNNWAPYTTSGGDGGWDSDAGADANAIAWLAVDMGTTRTFSHAKMFTLSDDINYAADPTTSETFEDYGNSAYRLQYWTGTADEFAAYKDSVWNSSLEQWTTFITVTGNDRVRRDHDFLDITARYVRFVGDATADHPSNAHARLVELEIWNRNPLWPVWGPLELRQKLVRENQWPNGLPSSSETSFTADGGPSAAFDLNGDSDLLTFNIISGLTLNGYVFQPVATPPESGVVRDAWVIMLLGHETVADGIGRVEYLVDRGFRVVLLGMPNFEPNSSSWTFTKQDSSTVNITGATHSQFETVIEADGQPILPLFLDQIFRAANWIRDQEPDAIIHLAGHSGGGFMCAMAAAMDDKQYFSVKQANAGENPFKIDSTAVHVEQDSDRPWWQGNDWDDLYPIAARFGKFTKSHNHQDPFFQAYQRYHVFRDLAAEVNAVIADDYEGSFDIYVDPDQTTHDYTEAMLERFVGDCLYFEPDLTPLDPTTIAWAAYIADSYTGLDDGDNVGNWEDATVNNRDATVIGTPQWYGNQLNGHAAIYVGGNSADGWTIPNMSSLTEGSSIEISKIIPTSSNGGSLFGTDGVNLNHFPYLPDGNIYDGFGSTARKGPITPTVDLTDWAVHYWWSKASDWGFQSNWNPAFTTATNTVGFPAAPKLWENAPGTAQKGYLVARWIFSTKLTADQKFRIALWIQQEFLAGFSTSFPGP